MIITEGIQPSPIGQGYPATPGLHRESAGSGDLEGDPHQADHDDAPQRRARHGFLIPVITMLGGGSLVIPNATAQPTSRHGEAAGTTAAVVGAIQSAWVRSSPRWSAFSATTASRPRALGGMPQREVLAAIELLGTEVAPVVRREVAAREVNVG